MELEQAERFARIAERDSDAMVDLYCALCRERSPFAVDEIRCARADVLAAQQVLMLARQELAWAQGAQAMAQAVEHARRMGLEADDEEGQQGVCARCGDRVSRAALLGGSGYTLCASCDQDERERA